MNSLGVMCGAMRYAEVTINGEFNPCFFESLLRLLMRCNNVKKMMIAVAMIISVNAFADEGIKPGNYVTEGNWGDLTVKLSGADLKFEINAVGSNAHTCEIEGVIRNQQGITEGGCVIQLVNKPDRISVVVSSEMQSQCREYCGMRAWFEGEYYPNVPYCNKTQKIRNEFLGFYKAKRYQEAKQALDELLGTCERFLTWHVQAEVRNDLAVTMLHLGDRGACLKALVPIKHTFIDDPAETGLVFTPVDEEWGEAMLKTTRFNWKKCGGVLPEYKQRN